MSTRSLIVQSIRSPARRRRGAQLLVPLLVLAVAAVTLAPQDPESGRYTNVVPFVNLLDQAPPATAAWNAVGNVLLFVPLGFCFPIALGRSRSALRWGTAAGLGLSSIIELYQWLVPTGRVADIDDVILNTLGALLGAMLVSRFAGRWASTIDEKPCL